MSIIQGDALHLPLADASIDAVVCDPPYGLEFMGKEWDAPWKTQGTVVTDVAAAGGFQDGNGGNPYSRSRIRFGRDGQAFQSWCETWAREAYRVLKPGGYLLAFGGTRATRARSRGRARIPAGAAVPREPGEAKRWQLTTPLPALGAGSPACEPRLPPSPTCVTTTRSSWHARPSTRKTPHGDWSGYGWRGMTAIAIQGNAMHLPLPDECVDLVVTSPPYFGLRSYTDDGRPVPDQVGGEPTPGEFIDALIAATAEMVRVLKPSGSIFVNLGDKYAGKSLMLLPERYRIAAVGRLGLIARAVIVWDKPNGLPESVTDRVRRSHEDWVHLTKLPRYYSAIDEIREPYAGEFLSSGVRNPRHGRPGGMMPFQQRGEVTSRMEVVIRGKVADTYGGRRHLGKLPDSVWRIPTAPLTLPAELGVDHFAAFPPEWPKRIIQGWSPTGGIVLDPFGGTGTTAMVAHALGRIGISVDLSHEYCQIAQWRTHDRAQMAKVRDEIFRKPVPQSEDQASLFTFAAVAQGGKQ
jgi:DNA modification methylase